MAWILTRLKYRLLANTLRLGAGRVTLFVLSACLALLVATIGFSALAVVPASSREPLAVIGCTILALAWWVLPLIAFGVDETLDPSRLALLPLHRRQLMTGLFVAGAVGPWPLATLLGLSGALIGYGESPAALLLVAAAITVEFGLCIVGARAITSSLSRLLRSRRGRDASYLIITLLGLALAGMNIALQRASRSGLDGPDLESWGALAWTPPGMAGKAMVDAADGKLLASAARIALAALTLVLGLLAWHRALASARITSDAPIRRRVPHGGVAQTLRPALIGRLLPRGPVGAVAARELRYLARDPVRRGQLPGMLFVGAWIPFSIAFTFHSPNAVFGLSGSGAIIGLTLVANQFGVDGTAYWTHVVIGPDPRRDLLGKNIAAAFVAVPALALAAALTAGLTDAWSRLPVALGVAAGALVMGAGVGNVVSVRAPMPAPDVSNPFSVKMGSGCAAGLYQMLAMLAVSVMLTPSIVLLAIGEAPASPAHLAAVAVALAEGIGVWVFGVRFAERFAWWRQPELLAAVTPDRAA